MCKNYSSNAGREQFANPQRNTGNVANIELGHGLLFGPSSEIVSPPPPLRST